MAKKKLTGRESISEKHEDRKKAVEERKEERKL